MDTNGGDIQSAFADLITCWDLNTDPDRQEPWNMTLPVVDCPSNNMGVCAELRGAVNVNVLWITEAGEDPHYDNAPTQMNNVPGYSSWASTDPNGSVRWNSFAQNFNLQNVDGSLAPYAKKSIYFLPDCTPHEPGGRSGGHNFGVLAEIPVLVQ
jgi:hypothetical protein